jgi:hypothetical protein
MKNVTNLISQGRARTDAEKNLQEYRLREAEKEKRILEDKLDSITENLLGYKSGDVTSPASKRVKLQDSKARQLHMEQEA